jgi:hypothetical protein
LFFGTIFTLFWVLVKRITRLGICFWEGRWCWLFSCLQVSNIGALFLSIEEGVQASREAHKLSTSFYR